MKLIQVGGHRRGSEFHGWAKVDDEDYDAVSQFKWTAHTRGYVCRKAWVDGLKVTVYLHRFILGLELGSDGEADHINRDKLDNRRANLRVVSRRENCQNLPAQRGSVSGFRGVRQARDRWQAYATVDGAFHHFGVFDTSSDAAEAARAGRLALAAGAVD